MEFVSGINIDNKDAMIKEGINIKEVSNLLAHCFARQIFEFGVDSAHQFLHADPHSGNVFARKVHDPRTGEHETQIVLLDHGLYKKLDEELKYSYSLLWKGILNQNEEEIRVASLRLGVKNHFMFAAMVTSKDWSDIMNKNERDEHKRLTRGTDKETKTDLQIKFNLYMEEIVRCLQQVDNDLMLVLKVNDYLRNIDGRLGNPVNSFIHIVASLDAGEVRLGDRHQVPHQAPEDWLLPQVELLLRRTPLDLQTQNVQVLAQQDHQSGEQNVVHLTWRCSRT